MHDSDPPKLSESQAMALEELARVLSPWTGAARTWAEQFDADEAEFAAQESTTIGNRGFRFRDEWRFSRN